MIEINLPLPAWICVIVGLILSGYYYGLRSKEKRLRCSICGSDKVKRVKQTETFEYKDHKVDIPDYESVECFFCGQSVADQKSVKRSEPLIRAMYAKADKENV